MVAPQKIQQGAAMPVSIIPFFPLGRHQAETLGAAVFAPTVENKATHILVQAITQNIRYTIDSGQPPTAAIGFLLLTTEAPVIIPLRGSTIRFLRDNAGAILQYQFGTA